MKVYEIRGELTITDDQNHQELIARLFENLKQHNIHFSGTTKNITDQK